MAKKIIALIKLALTAAKATPAPPVGPALGQHGVNIAAFCKEFNAKTNDKNGLIIPVEILVYEDRSYTFILKTPPASVLLANAAKIKKLLNFPSLKNLYSSKSIIFLKTLIGKDMEFAKYRIEIEINYQLIQLNSGDVISEGTTRGFAQYDTVDSEIINEDTRKSMTKIAAKNALQIMSSRIQSSILK